MSTSRGRRALTLALVAVAALLAAACSGAPRPADDVATGELAPAPGSVGGSGTGTGDVAAGVPGAPGVTATGSTGSPGSPGDVASTAGAPGAPGSAGAPAAPGSPGAPTPGVDPGAGIPLATLYGPEQDRVGITDDTITLCVHAALVLAQAFNTRPEDLNVYWEMVRDRGGIHGRNVEVTYEDDAYRPDNAVQAANRCKQRNPFLLLGGIGFDQIPAVQSWAEANEMLYVHHIAVARGGEGKRFSFTLQPTVEDVGVAFGEYLVSHHRDAPIGVVYRESENWQPGHDAGIAHLESAGVDVVSDLGVTQNQGIYSAEVIELKNRGAEVVWLWENALVAAQFIQQAHSQDYFPTFVVFPFQTTLDVLGDNALRSVIEGVATWPAYKPGGFGDEYAEHGYAAELARFEAAYAQYRPGVALNDILWQTWLGNKVLDDMFTRCGIDCTRNRFAGLMLSGYQASFEGGCPVDFTVDPHRGGHSYTTMTAYDPGGVPAFRTTQWCSSHL